MVSVAPDLQPFGKPLDGSRIGVRSGSYLDGTSNLSNSVQAYGAIDVAANKIAVMLLNIDTSGQHICTIRLNSIPIGAGECQINIPAGVGVDYSQTIGSQTSMVLIFNLQGQLVKTISYSSASNASDSAPVTVSFP